MHSKYPLSTKPNPRCGQTSTLARRLELFPTPGVDYTYVGDWLRVIAWTKNGGHGVDLIVRTCGAVLVLVVVDTTMLIRR